MKSIVDLCEGFVSGPHDSLWDYVVSFHCVPFTVVLSLSVLLCAAGALSVMPILITLFSFIITAVLFVILPLPIIGPIGGYYNVGLIHLDGNRSRNIPPLAVFYPTDVSSQKSGVPYVPFNDPLYLTGMATYGKVPLYVMKDTLFVRLKASLGATPIPLDGFKTPPPIVVFSHGLGGHYQFYSALCGDLAARGAIVVSIGHCDGSASFMRIVQDDKSGKNDVHFKDLGWEVPVREAQLAQRVRECRQTLQRLKEIDFWKEVGFAELDVRNYLSQSLQIHLSGHSFGGATVLSAALQEEQIPSKNPVKSVTVFDPWELPLQNEHFLQPIEEGKMKYTTPTHAVFSEDWTKDSEIFGFFQRTASAVLAQASFSLKEEEKRKLFVIETANETNHYFLSDLCLLSPIFHGKPNAIVPPRARIVECSNTIMRVAKQHMNIVNL